MNFHTFDTDSPSDEVFLDFRDPGDLTYSSGTRKNLTCMCFATSLTSAMETRTKDTTYGRVYIWDFGSLFVPYGLSEIIIMDADGVFSGVFKIYLRKFCKYQCTQWHGKILEH